MVAYNFYLCPMQKIYNRNNFHKHTFCVFKEVDSASLNALSPNYKSDSGSSYYFTEAGVYRVSNHWGRAANCRWRLESDTVKTNQTMRVGYANWTDFYPNNEKENLFYLQVNFETKEVHFQHKDHPEYDGKAIVRNASATAKVIRQVKELLTSDIWAKYLEVDNIEETRRGIINQLVFSTATLIEIKRKLQ